MGVGNSPTHPARQFSNVGGGVWSECCFSKKTKIVLGGRTLFWPPELLGSVAYLCSVLFPIARANPAELVFTEAANDVIAASRLLDAARAHWTIFCLRRDVVGCFRIVAAFLQPDFDRRALCRVVKIEAALEAELRCARLALKRG